MFAQTYPLFLILASDGRIRGHGARQIDARLLLFGVLVLGLILLITAAGFAFSDWAIRSTASLVLGWRQSNQWARALSCLLDCLIALVASLGSVLVVGGALFGAAVPSGWIIFVALLMYLFHVSHIFNERRKTFRKLASRGAEASHNQIANRL